MRLTHHVFAMAVGALALTSLIGAVPVTHAAPVAAASRPQGTAAAAALRHNIQQRFPKAVVQINQIGKTSSYALYVTLLAQPSATLAGGSGAQVLAWYIAAYPHQPLYALYSYEKDTTGPGFWEYEFVPTNTILRRYRFSFNSTHSYPWYSWKLTQADIGRAAQAGKWPSNAVVHQPVAQPPASQHKK